MSAFRILQGDCRAALQDLPDESVNCCVTSPPYFGLRDYGVHGQIGLEPEPAQFISALVGVFAEVRRVLRPDGTLWVNLGDSYASTGGKNTTPQTGTIFAGRTRGKEVICRAKRIPRGAGRWGGGNAQSCGPLKPKDLMMMPARVAIALQDDGWYLRSDIIWHKPNPMPESVNDRPTKAHEYIFLLAKSERYYYDGPAIREQHATKPVSFAVEPITVRPKGTGHRTPHSGAVGKGGSHRTEASYPEGGRNRRTVWTVSTCPTPEAHFATYPPDLIEPCILAGCPEGGVVLDPFAGAGTTGLACLKHGRRFIGLELNPEYIEIAYARARKYYPLLAQEAS